MAEYIQSNNDSGDLAIYAGIGLAGAAGGAALTYRATRDPSNGKTSATGKSKSTPDTAKTTGGSKLGFMSNLFGKKEAPTTGSTLPAESFLVSNPLKGATSTQAPGGLDFNLPTNGTVGTAVPSKATASSVASSVATPKATSTTASSVASTTASSAPSHVMNADHLVPMNANLNNITSTEALGGLENMAASTGTSASRQSSTINANDLHRYQTPGSDKPVRKMQGGGVDITSAEAVHSPNMNLDGVGQSVAAKRKSGKSRSRRGRRGGLRGFL